MSPAIEVQNIRWALWQNILFRFFLIYILLQVLPWWINIIPGLDFITKYYFQIINLLVQFANADLFHVKKILVHPNGSGDTSYGWAEQWTFLFLALLGCIMWTLIDQKRTNYSKLNYWLSLVTRYYLALVAFTYGFFKILLLQMGFPSLSQLATPLGDFLPMRLSWMFIGYSPLYQIFSGFMECLVGLLLLFRRTTTLGVFVATGVFINVLMLNLSYDIPVKLFSMNLVLFCLFLVANEYDRIACFFILNKRASTCKLYHFSYSGKWMRMTRIILKFGFLIVIVMQFLDTGKEYKNYMNQKQVKPIKHGMYDVAVYAINKDTLPPLITDTLRWQDVVFDIGGIGSLKTDDTLFQQRYNRAYFVFVTDTISQTLIFRKSEQDNTPLLSLHYLLPDSSTILLWGKRQNDSLYVELKKSNRHFQLAERQFHWLSEANR